MGQLHQDVPPGFGLDLKPLIGFDIMDVPCLHRKQLKLSQGIAHVGCVLPELFADLEGYDGQHDRFQVYEEQEECRLFFSCIRTLARGPLVVRDLFAFVAEVGEGIDRRSWLLVPATIKYPSHAIDDAGAVTLDDLRDDLLVVHCGPVAQESEMLDGEAAADGVHVVCPPVVLVGLGEDRENALPNERCCPDDEGPLQQCKSVREGDAEANDDDDTGCRPPRRADQHQLTRLRVNAFLLYVLLVFEVHVIVCPFGCYSSIQSQINRVMLRHVTHEKMTTLMSAMTDVGWA